LFCSALTDIAVKGDAIVAQRPKSLYDTTLTTANRVKGWIVDPKSNVTVHLDKAYGLAVYKHGQTTTVLLSDPSAPVSRLMNGFIVLKHQVWMDRTPKGCKGFFMYNRDDFSVLHGGANGSVGLRMMEVWCRWFKTEKQRASDHPVKSIDQQLSVKDDTVYCYTERMDWIILVAVDKPLLIDDTIDQLMALVF
jgi:hypothetical protein